MSHRLGLPRRPLRGGVRREWDPGEAGWWRLYHRDYRTPNARHRRKFGPVSRFDHHEPDSAGLPRDDPSGREAIYLGETRLTCAAETLWDQLPAPGDPPDGPRIARVCFRYRLAQLRPKSPVTLLRLDESHADAIGALPELATGPTSEHPMAQEWARAIYEDLDVHGIYYPAAHNLGTSMVLWDHAPELEVVRDGGRPRDLSLHDPRLWDRILVEYSINDRSLVKIEPYECPKCRKAGLR